MSALSESKVGGLALVVGEGLILCSVSFVSGVLLVGPVDGADLVRLTRVHSRCREWPRHIAALVTLGLVVAYDQLRVRGGARLGRPSVGVMCLPTSMWGEPWTV